MARSRTLVKPAYLSAPEYTSTNGDLAADMGAQVGLVPDAEQRLILDAMFAESRPGVPVCFEVANIAPRQNMKTALLQIAALTDLFVLEEPLIIWTAHLFKTAKAAFEGLAKLVDTTPHLKSQCRPHRTANGDEAIELKSGQRIEFHARSKGGGRGLTGDKIILDEALFLSASEIGAVVPTLATRPGAQIRYASSAGLLQSEVLRGVRDRGRAGESRLFYAEWCAPRTPCDDEHCAHFYGTPGCALDRVDLRRLANPAFGRRISEEMLEQFRRAMPPDEFMREFLGWWDDPPEDGAKAIASADWKACLDLLSKFGPGGNALGLQLDGARAVAYVGGAGWRADGDTKHVEILKAVAPTDVVSTIVELQQKRRAPLVLDPGSHAGSYIVDLEAAGVEVIKVTLTMLAQACGRVIDDVKANKLRHLGQPQLDAAVRGAGVRTTSRDAWAWDGPATAPLSAVTLALHGLPDQYDVLESVW